MRLKFLTSNSFRGKKIKKGAIKVIPDGVANKLIANGLAVKA